MKLVITALYLAVLALTAHAAGEADTVYHNGRVYTVNESQAWVEAVAIKDGKFIAVGSNATIEAYIGSSTQVIDLDGKMVMPGFTDAHLHAHIPFLEEERGNLRMDAATAEEVKEALIAWDKANPGDGWIRAEKFRLGAFPEGKTSRQWIDAIIPHRPVYLVDETGHNGVANTKALEIAGITKDTLDPDGGFIERDTQTGEPTGFVGETGMGLLGRHLPELTVDIVRRSLERSQVELSAFGITSFIDMLAFPKSLEAYKQMEQHDKLPFRISAAVALNEYTDEVVQAEEAVAVFERASDFDTELVKVDSFKYWADGTPLSFTSLLVEDYANRPDKGAHTLLPAHMERAQSFLNEGKIGRFHSIGDGTARTVLNMAEEARKSNPDNTQPIHLGHCMMVHPDDFHRFKDLNVIAEFSPAFWFPLPVTQILPKYIGDERTSQVSPVADLLDAGALVVIGSDWPAGTPTADPFRGLEGLVTRMDPWERNPGTLGRPISLEDAIQCMTLNGTKAMQMDDKIGSIEVGKHADMIILDQNLFDIPPEDISNTRPLYTIFDGKVVYDASKDPAPQTRLAHSTVRFGEETLALLGGCARCAQAHQHAHDLMIE